jgi:hypothetical protein
MSTHPGIIPQALITAFSGMTLDKITLTAGKPDAVESRRFARFAQERPLPISRGSASSRTSTIASDRLFHFLTIRDNKGEFRRSVSRFSAFFSQVFAIQLALEPEDRRLHGSPAARVGDNRQKKA